jgi:DNA-binding Lrp family transcriptional regulator
VFCFVKLSSQAEADLVAFETCVREWDVVRECYMLSGDVDFVLKCVAQDLRTFQTFVIEQLTKAPAVANVRTALTLKATKSEPTVPLRP